MAGRLLLVFRHLVNQADDADDHHAELKEFPISNHMAHPLPLEDRGQEVSPPEKGEAACASGSARFLSEPS